MMTALTNAFRFDGRVTRREYLAVGMALAVLRYAGDALLMWVSAKTLWTPLQDLSPMLTTRTEVLGPQANLALLALALWSLPFLWVGFAMTGRRAFDAGYSRWTALLFLVPGLNVLTVLGLSCLPPAERPPSNAKLVALDDSKLRSVVAGTVAAVAFAVAATLVSVAAFESYGMGLFLGTPVVVGAISAFALNRGRQVSWSETQATMTMSLVATVLVLLAFAVEGVICLAMASPIAWVGGALGAMLGRAVAGDAGGKPAAVQFGFIAAVLPLVIGVEAHLAKPETFEVSTAVEVQASPEAVWMRVVSFPPLAPPTDALSKLGVAYPTQARIDGVGVGAVRHCEFSTGAFVEPITRWEPPARLSFDVTQQPAPMLELTPYRGIEAPHLDGYFKSVRGEFRIVPLGPNRTRLEGSTWYTLRIFPAVYWRLWSDGIVHSIHERVLQHVSALAEADTTAKLQ